MYGTYSVCNTTDLKLQIEQKVSYKLETANCTLQYLSQKNGCLCEAQTHDLHIRARPTSDETTCTLNSFYLVFMVLILYSHQVSIFMKQPCSTHNRFCSEKKKKVVRVRLELTTWTFSACLQYLSQKRVVFVRFELTTFTL